MKITEKRKNKIKSVVGKRQDGLRIVLVDIHDPHNAGAVLRSADAFGIQYIDVIFIHEKPYNLKKVTKSSSATANKWVTITVYNNIKKYFNMIREKQYNIYATALMLSAVPIHSVDWSRNTALVFGNEKQGLSKKVVSLCDEVVYIPMHGMVQSLNLSVTAGICMYAVTEQRRKDKNIRPLPKHEQNRVINSLTAS